MDMVIRSDNDDDVQIEAEEAQTAMTLNTANKNLRMLEAMLFAAIEPVPEASLADRLPEGCDVPALLAELRALYEGRGINLIPVAGRWAFRTAPDLADTLEIEINVSRKLSRAAVETLAIIAYHQPVTRGDIEEIRGVALSKGTLDVLLEIGWIRPVGRRRTPGRPVTWGTSADFLGHFNLNELTDLPGIDEMKAAGLMDTRSVRTIFGEGNVTGVDKGEGDGTDADASDLVEALDPTDGEPVDPSEEEAIGSTDDVVVDLASDDALDPAVEEGVDRPGSASMERLMAG